MTSPLLSVQLSVTQKYSYGMKLKNSLMKPVMPEQHYLIRTAVLNHLKVIK